jgi:hypothetical protein
MFNRNVSGPLFEVSHRVTAGGHQVAEQLIGLSYCTRRGIHKVRLHAIPLLGVARTIFGRKRTKVEFLYALGALLKPRLCAMAIAALRNCSVIFWSEVLAKLIGTSPLQIESHDGANNNHDDGNDNSDLGGGKILHVHDPGSSCVYV